MRLFKRVLDVALAGVAFVVASPVMLLIALAIRLETHGSVFFVQDRVGRGKQHFAVFKFRSMFDRPAQSIDQASERVLATGHDPRITRVGRVLRRYSLDELPQVINVLKGEMSLVGPRPVLPEQLTAMGPESDDRFAVRPGMTGLVQVSGRRGLSWPQQLALDVEYARNVTFAGDAAIVARTFAVVWSGAGVYGAEADNWRRHIRR